MLRAPYHHRMRWLILIVSVPQSRAIWELGLSEGLSSSSWPMSMFQGIFLIGLIDVGKCTMNVDGAISWARPLTIWEWTVGLSEKCACIHFSPPLTVDGLWLAGLGSRCCGSPAVMDHHLELWAKTNIFASKKACSWGILSSSQQQEWS